MLMEQGYVRMKSRVFVVVFMAFITSNSFANTCTVEQSRPNGKPSNVLVNTDRTLRHCFHLWFQNEAATFAHRIRLIWD
jgi:hypothetical protein